jgi:hypothetical protein
MKKKCKRKVYPMINTIAHSIEGACITEDAHLELLKAHELKMIDALLSGNDGLSGYYGLCELLGCAETMAKAGIGPEVLEPCANAQAVLIKLHTRFKRWNKWDITPSEKQTLIDLMEWHHLQRTSLARSEYESYLKLAINKMRSRAPGVIEL